MKDMVELKARIEASYETPEEYKDQTILVHVCGGSYEESMQHATYHGSAVDCDGDTVPFIIQWFKSDHFEVCQLFNAAAHSLLEAEGGAVVHGFKDVS